MAQLILDLENLSGGGGACEILIPNMTGASSPSGNASADTAYSGYDAYFAFSSNTTKGWFISGAAFTGHYIVYEFPSPVVAKASLATGVGTNAGNYTYTLYGSNDSSFASADTLLTGASGTSNYYDMNTAVTSFNNSKAYKYYKWSITASTLTTGSGGIKLNLLG